MKLDTIIPDRFICTTLKQQCISPKIYLVYIMCTVWVNKDNLNNLKITKQRKKILKLAKFQAECLAVHGDWLLLIAS